MHPAMYIIYTCDYVRPTAQKGSTGQAAFYPPFRPTPPPGPPNRALAYPQTTIQHHTMVVCGPLG